jgi:predicted phage terminase large subunit-like protein
MPPRSLKSIAASVAFPAFVLGHDPSRRIICVSYSGDLAKKHSNDFRAVLEAPWYRSLFPRTRVGPFKNSETEIELTERGFRLATSVGGTLTGRGGDIIVIDDPLKPDDALSDTKRSGANQWFTNTLLSRQDDKRTGVIVVVMQGVHIDDLSGFLLAQSDEWEVLSFPAIAYNDQNIPTWAGGTYHYQQEPAPPGGAMVKRHWVKRYRELPPDAERLFVLQSWDTASKGGPENDWSVCTTWLVARGKKWYLINVWRDRVDYPELKAKAQSLALEWKAQRVLVEDSGAGTALVQELRGRVPGVIAVNSQRDKVTRMAVASSKIEAGQVFVPERAPWLADLEAELFVFPGGRHDDQCDSISQALEDNNVSFMQWFTPADWQRVLAQARVPTRRTFYGSLTRL